MGHARSVLAAIRLDVTTTPAVVTAAATAFARSQVLRGLSEDNGPQLLLTLAALFPNAPLGVMNRGDADAIRDACFGLDSYYVRDVDVCELGAVFRGSLRVKARERRHACFVSSTLSSRVSLVRFGRCSSSLRACVRRRTRRYALPHSARLFDMLRGAAVAARAAPFTRCPTPLCGRGALFLLSLSRRKCATIDRRSAPPPPPSPLR